MGILDGIVLKKKERLAAAKSAFSLTDLKIKIRDVDAPRDFTGAIKRRPNRKISLIAEIKRASPSKGIIKKDFDHLSLARFYEEGKVDAVSILTEEDFFQGSLSFLSEVKQVMTKPVLRKDFIFDEYQIYEARAHNADAILLIAAILETNQALEYLHIARDLGLAVLFEAHNYQELEMALRLDCDIIGINNRDLKTLTIDLRTTFKLKKEIPPHKIVVSESGIKTREDVLKIEEAGIDAMLIGTSLMETDDIDKKINELQGIHMIQ
jgi:indole-3-glycerol phosphate synthase